MTASGCASRGVSYAGGVNPRTRSRIVTAALVLLVALVVISAVIH